MTWKSGHITWKPDDRFIAKRAFSCVNIACHEETDGVGKWETNQNDKI